MDILRGAFFKLCSISVIPLLLNAFLHMLMASNFVQNTRPSASNVASLSCKLLPSMFRSLRFLQFLRQEPST